MKQTKQTITNERSTVGILIAATTFLGSLLVLFSLYGPYVNSKTFAICIGTAVCLLAFLLAYPIQKAKILLHKPAFWGIVVYMASLIVISVTSIDPAISWLGLPVRATSTLLLLVLGILALIIGASLSKEQVKKYVFFPISVSGALIALSVYAEKWGMRFFASASHGGLLGNTSYVGAYIIFSFFITGYLFFYSSRNKKIMYACFALLSILNPIFINFSFSAKNGIFDIVGDARAAALSLVIGLLVGLFAWLATSARKSSRIAGRGGIMVSGLVFVVLIMQLLSSTSSLHNWFIQKASDTRFIYWNIAMQGFHDSPIVGNGPETYTYTYQKHFNPEMYLAKNNAEVWSDKPHNVYLEILSSGGIIGLIGYMALLVTLVYSIYQGYKMHNDRLYLASMYALLAAYVVNNIVIFDTPTSYLLLFAVIGASLSYAKGNEELLVRFKNKGQKILQGIAGFAVLVLVVIILIPPIVKMHRENTDLSLVFEDKIAWYPKTEQGSSYGSGINLSERSGQLYTDQLQPNLNSIVTETPANKDITIRLIDSLVGTMQNLFKKYPKDVQGLVNIGKIESIKMAIQNKTDEQSLNIMTQAANDSIQIAPKNPAGYWLLGQVYTYEGKFDQAFAEFETARLIEPGIADSHSNLIRLAAFLGDKKKVAIYTERALQESEDFRNAQ